MTDQARRFPVGLTIAVAISLSILIGLGVWQLQRLAWKESLLARVEALEADQAPRKYTTDELRAIRDEYRAKARELKREAANV